MERALVGASPISHSESELANMSTERDDVRGRSSASCSCPDDSVLHAATGRRRNGVGTPPRRTLTLRAKQPSSALVRFETEVSGIDEDAKTTTCLATSQRRLPDVPHIRHVSCSSRWWDLLVSVDVHQRFASLPSFIRALRHFADRDASLFYAAMVNVFETWRHDVCKLIDAQAQPSSGATGSLRRGRKPATKDERSDGTMTLLHAQALLYDSLRVERVVAHEVLLVEVSKSHTGEASIWTFVHGCPKAMASANLDENKVLYIDTNGCQGELQCKVVAEGTGLTGSSGSKLIFVPSAWRVLLLLRVIDELWSQPTASLAFRWPVSEKEAPGYHRRIKDPVSLCSLYEDVFRGVPPSHFLSRSGPLPARNLPSSPVGPTTLVGMNYAILRERLYTMRRNCALYNGEGTSLTCMCDELVQVGNRAIREAQHVEEQAGDSAIFHATIALEGVQPTTAERASSSIFAPLSKHQLLEVFPPMAVTNDIAIDDVNSTASMLTAERNRSVGVKRTFSLSTGQMRREKNTPDTDSFLSPPVRKQRGRPRRSDEGKQFWICCDRCRTWRAIPQKLDPAPASWECAHSGGVCDPKQLEEIEEKRKQHETATRGSASRRKPTSKCEGGLQVKRRPGRPPRVSVATTTKTALKERTAEEDVSLADQFYGAVKESRRRTKKKAKVERASRRGRRRTSCASSQDTSSRSSSYSVSSSSSESQSGRGGSVGSSPSSGQLSTGEEAVHLTKLEAMVEELEAMPVDASPFTLLRRLRDAGKQLTAARTANVV